MARFSVIFAIACAVGLLLPKGHLHAAPPEYGSWTNTVVKEKHGVGTVKLGETAPADWPTFLGWLEARISAMPGGDSALIQSAMAMEQEEEVRFLRRFLSHGDPAADRLPRLANGPTTRFHERYGRWYLELPSLTVGDYAYIAFAETDANQQVEHIVLVSLNEKACEALIGGLWQVYGQPELHSWDNRSSANLVEVTWHPFDPKTWSKEVRHDFMWGWGSKSGGDPESYRYWFQGFTTRDQTDYCALHTLNSSGFEKLEGHLKGGVQRAAGDL